MLLYKPLSRAQNLQNHPGLNCAIKKVQSQESFKKNSKLIKNSFKRKPMIANATNLKSVSYLMHSKMSVKLASNNKFFPDLFINDITNIYLLFIHIFHQKHLKSVPKIRRCAKIKDYANRCR